MRQMPRRRRFGRVFRIPPGTSMIAWAVMKTAPSFSVAAGPEEAAGQQDATGTQGPGASGCARGTGLVQIGTYVLACICIKGKEK